MKRMMVCACLASALAGSMAQAARPETPDVARASRSETRIAVGELQPTPEMWFYEQYQQQYDDPAIAVRRNAELRAAQRQNRLAARRWYGLSNSRPQVSSDPFHGDYSPRWTSNHGHYPLRWVGRGPSVVIIHTDE